MSNGEEPMETDDDNDITHSQARNVPRIRTSQVDKYIYNYIVQTRPDIVNDLNHHQCVDFQKHEETDTHITFKLASRDGSIPDDKIQEIEDQFDKFCRDLIEEMALKQFQPNWSKFPNIDRVREVTRKELEGHPVAFQINESGKIPILELIGKTRDIEAVSEQLKRLGVIKDMKNCYFDVVDKDGKLTFTTERQIKVMIYNGDITKQNTTGIVNPTDGNLSDIGSVSRAIHMADQTGEMKNLCQMHREVNGQLSIGDVVCTKAGAAVNYKFVIHAVGPITHWDLGKTQLLDQLKKAILNSILCLEKELQFDTTEGSISIPAIGSGNGGIELSLVSEAFKEAIFEFDNQCRSNNKVREIHLVNIDAMTTDFLKSYFVKEIETFKKRTGDHSNMTNGATNIPQQSAAGSDSKDEDCCICMDTIKIPKELPCKHRYCKDCIDQHEKISGPKCPQCFVPFGKIKGNQPDGTFNMSTQRFPSLSGHESCGTITINYNIPSGTQTERHPHPGQRFHGTSRTAYLPDNDEGRDIAKLLKQAFDDHHIFTVGRSVTTGADNSVIWNDIHHKTVMNGSPYGYPDPQYLKRVREELRTKGIVSEEGDKKYAKK